jgi:hypothetical protein
MQFSELIANICAITGNISILFTYIISMLNQGLFETDLIDYLICVKQETKNIQKDRLDY